eukprot:COSAG01_NODE_1378_length_10526_cov_13.789105_7_plen_57_part_00
MWPQNHARDSLATGPNPPQEEEEEEEEGEEEEEDDDGDLDDSEPVRIRLMQPRQAH